MAKLTIEQIRQLPNDELDRRIHSGNVVQFVLDGLNMPVQSYSTDRDIMFALADKIPMKSRSAYFWAAGRQGTSWLWVGTPRKHAEAFLFVTQGGAS